MKAIRRQSGFSLTEVLLAIGTMAIGMLFVGGVFMLGVHQTTVAMEKTIASVAAAEAFGKIQAYGLAAIDPNDPNVGLYNHTPYTFADTNEHYYAAQDPAASAGQGGLSRGAHSIPGLRLRVPYQEARRKRLFLCYVIKRTTF